MITYILFLFLSFLLYSYPVAGPLRQLNQMRTFLPYFLLKKKVSEKVIFLSLLTVSFSLSLLNLPLCIQQICFLTIDSI